MADPTIDPDFVKELADLVEGDAWVLADRLVEQFPVETYGGGTSAHATTSTSCSRSIRTHSAAGTGSS